MVLSIILTTIYSALALKAILCSYRKFDRFSLTLTAISLLSMLLLTAALILSFMVTKSNNLSDKQLWSYLYIGIEMNWFSTSLLTLCFDVFVFKGLC
jgi:hypothetical protein